jgi:hypothetical protein
MQTVAVTSGLQSLHGGAYAEVDAAGSVTLSAWAGSHEIRLPLNRDQADALAYQMLSRGAPGVTHTFGAARLFAAVFDNPSKPL